VAQANRVELITRRWYDSIARVLLPEALGIPAGSGVTLRLTIPGATLDLPVQVAGSIAGEAAVVPAELPGLLRTAVDRRVSMDPDLRMPVLDPPGHRGFRLYARRLDDVPVLHRHFLEREIEVDAKLGDIQRVQALDRGLTRLFWLVAAVGIVGGIACLMASLHGAVQRKRRDLGMLRLLGLPRRHLLAFPLAQAAVIAWLAFGLAVVGFFGFAWIINTVFAADLPVGRQLCLLPAQHLLVAGLLTTAMAQVSAIWAALSVTGIDPAEAIRVE
jgi:putative ABC transport system permease protein